MPRSLSFWRCFVPRCDDQPVRTANVSVYESLGPRRDEPGCLRNSPGRLGYDSVSLNYRKIDVGADGACARYWQAYQSTAYPFYPVLVAVNDFGRSLFSFLNERGSFTADPAKQQPEPDSSWLALLFAVMACGVQFTDDPTKERDLRSKVFSMRFLCMVTAEYALITV